MIVSLYPTMGLAFKNVEEGMSYLASSKINFLISGPRVWILISSHNYYVFVLFRFVLLFVCLFVCFCFVLFCFVVVVVLLLFFNLSSASFRTEISALVSIMNSVGVPSTVRIAPGLGRGLSPDSPSHHLLGEKP